MSENGRPGRITPGPLKGQISARAWNRAQDAADIVLGQDDQVVAAGPRDAAPPYTPILVKNGTTGIVSRWGVLSVAGVVFTPSGSTGAATRQFQDQPVLSGGLPTGGSSFVVAVEPIKVGGLGRCAVAGVVQCKINVVSASDTFATAKDGDLTQLTSSSSGEATILWKESGTGANKWALVRFGAAAGQTTMLGKANTGTWNWNTYATVTQWRGDGSAEVSGPVTVQVLNLAQTVTGPTGGWWVGCDKTDDTWLLKWTQCS